jgi:hypothetical protein
MCSASQIADIGRAAVGSDKARPTQGFMHALVVTTSLSAVWSRLTAELLPILSAYRARLADLDVAVKADDTLLSEADIAVQERLPQSENGQVARP